MAKFNSLTTLYFSFRKKIIIKFMDYNFINFYFYIKCLWYFFSTFRDFKFRSYFC